MTCDYRHCREPAFVRLYFGVPTPAPASYCARHALVVTSLFHISDDPPATCDASNQHGEPCQRRPARGRDYCAIHKHLAPAA